MIEQPIPNNSPAAANTSPTVTDRVCVDMSRKPPAAAWWPSRFRGAPWSFLRNGLFGATRRGEHEHLKEHVFPMADGMTTVYTGPQLNQFDLGTWLQCCHVAKDVAPGATIEVSGSEFQKAVGRPTGTREQRCRHKSLGRLNAGLVRASSPKASYAGLLIEDYQLLEKARFQFRINPAMWDFFRAGYAQLLWSERLALQGQPLAEWLHAFYASHRTTISLKVETLAMWCGSQATSITDFRHRLKTALDYVCAKTGSTTWRYDKHGNVYVEKRLTRKHDMYEALKAINPDMDRAQLKELVVQMREFEEELAARTSRRAAKSDRVAKPGQ